MRLLLAEDESSLARAVVTILKKNNYEAEAVDNGIDQVLVLYSASNFSSDNNLFKLGL